MPDKVLVCVDCGSDFTFTVRDQEFFAKQNPPFNDPKRCKPCRDVKKQSKMRQDQQRG